VTATEFSEAAVANIQQKFPQIPVYTGEVEDIGLKAETFDVIAAWHSLEHMRFPFKALAAMYEALNPGGSLGRSEKLPIHGTIKAIGRQS